MPSVFPQGRGLYPKLAEFSGSGQSLPATTSRESLIGVPYGSLARLILLYLQTEAIRTRTQDHTYCLLPCAQNRMCRTHCEFDRIRQSTSDVNSRIKDASTCPASISGLREWRSAAVRKLS